MHRVCKIELHTTQVSSPVTDEQVRGVGHDPIVCNEQGHDVNAHTSCSALHLCVWAQPNIHDMSGARSPEETFKPQTSEQQHLRANIRHWTAKHGVQWGGNVVRPSSLSSAGVCASRAFDVGYRAGGNSSSVRAKKGEETSDMHVTQGVPGAVY